MEALRSSYIAAALIFLFAQNAFATDFKLTYYGLTQGRLAFSCRTGNNADLFVLDFERAEVTPLLTTKAVEEYPAWSPDGLRLVYYSNETGDNEIYSVSYSGSDIQRLTKNPAADEDPNWSPDGKKIVFQSNRGEDPEAQNIFVMNADGSNQTQLTHSTKKNSVPKWSPRGDQIIYTTNTFWPGWDLMLLELKTGASTQISKGYRSFCRAQWSPDGSAFAFSYGAGDEIALWLKKKIDAAPAELVSLEGKSYDAEWTDEGKQIFFVNQKSKELPYELYVFELETGQAKKVFETPCSVRYLSWTPLPSPALKGAEPTAVTSAPTAASGPSSSDAVSPEAAQPAGGKSPS